MDCFISYRLKCAFENGRKTPSAPIIKQPGEISPTRLPATSLDPTLNEMQKIVTKLFLVSSIPIRMSFVLVERIHYIAENNDDSNIKRSPTNSKFTFNHLRTLNCNFTMGHV